VEGRRGKPRLYGLRDGVLRDTLVDRVYCAYGDVVSMQLRMSTRTVNGVLVVDCSGRVVFGEESATLRDTVKKLIAQSPNIVLSLREVNFIDSGGLGTLVSLYTTARNAGGAVKLARLSQRVGDLLQVTKLLTIFEVFDDEEEAAKSFKKDAA
jgi:anti-sigma B factor antagonist